jgi:hypothetical protein
MLLFTVHDTLLPHLHLIISLYLLLCSCGLAVLSADDIILLGLKEFNWLLKSQLQIFLILKRVLHKYSDSSITDSSTQINLT